MEKRRTGWNGPFLHRQKALPNHKVRCTRESISYCPRWHLNLKTGSQVAFAVNKFKCGFWIQRSQFHKISNFSWIRSRKAFTNTHREGTPSLMVPVKWDEKDLLRFSSLCPEHLKLPDVRFFAQRSVWSEDPAILFYLKIWTSRWWKLEQKFLLPSTTLMRQST